MGRGRAAMGESPRPRKRIRAVQDGVVDVVRPEALREAPDVGQKVAAHVDPRGCDPPAFAVVVAIDEKDGIVVKAYVHFDGLDRRLDRWVPAGALFPATDAVALPTPDEAMGLAHIRKRGDDDSKLTRPVRSSTRATRGIRGSAAREARAAAAAAEASGDAQNDGVIVLDDTGESDVDVVGTKSTPVVASRKVTRSQRRALEEFNPTSEREEGNETIASLERQREEQTKVRNISSVVFGEYHVDVWYFSPYPGKCSSLDVLYICPSCLKYMRSPGRYASHRDRCQWRKPPGALIYADADRKVSVYEVDGLINVPYCQRLCLLGKLFLDHKTLYFDVGPFLFYVVCFSGELAAFFSKEKPLVESSFNLACIVTMPQHQRKGLGCFMIALSYELTKREGKTGSPERPLSDLGQLSYRSYWAHGIMSFVRRKRGAVGISVKDVADATGIQVADVNATLKSLGILTIWKRENYVDTNQKTLESAQKRVKKPRLPLVASLLTWSPVKRQDGTQLAGVASSPHPSLPTNLPPGSAPAVSGVVTPANTGRSRRKASRRQTSSTRGRSTPGGVGSSTIAKASPASRPGSASEGRQSSAKALAANSKVTKLELDKQGDTAGGFEAGESGLLARRKPASSSDIKTDTECFTDKFASGRRGVGRDSALGKGKTLGKAAEELSTDPRVHALPGSVGDTRSPNSGSESGIDRRCGRGKLGVPSGRAGAGAGVTVDAGESGDSGGCGTDSEVLGRVEPINGCNVVESVVTPHAPRTGTRRLPMSAIGNASAASSSVAGALNETFVMKKGDLLAMKEFVLLHTAEKVHSPLDTPCGMLSADVHILAESLNMSMSLCRKKLKRLSGDALLDPSILMTSKEDHDNMASSSGLAASVDRVPAPLNAKEHESMIVAGVVRDGDAYSNDDDWGLNEGAEVGKEVTYEELGAKFAGRLKSSSAVFRPEKPKASDDLGTTACVAPRTTSGLSGFDESIIDHERVAAEERIHGLSVRVCRESACPNSNESEAGCEDVAPRSSQACESPKL